MMNNKDRLNELKKILKYYKMDKPPLSNAKFVEDYDNTKAKEGLKLLKQLSANIDKLEKALDYYKGRDFFGTNYKPRW